MANQMSVLSAKRIRAQFVRQSLGKALFYAAIYAFLLVMAVIVLFPFYWMLISSVKTLDEYRLSVPTFWPRVLMLNNYISAFTTAKLGRLFVNTMIVGLVSTLLSLVITILTAFAFARLEFKGKELLFAALLATMMIPGELFTITNYGTITTFGWKNTYTVLIVPFLVSVFYIYLLRQSFLQIPNELYLAAKVHQGHQIPVEGHGAPVPAHADFHHHPENDGRVEFLYLAAPGGKRRRAPVDYQRPAQRLYRYHGRRKLSRADGGRRAGIRSAVPGVRVPAQVYHVRRQPQRYQGLIGRPRPVT